MNICIINMGPKKGNASGIKYFKTYMDTIKKRLNKPVTFTAINIYESDFNRCRGCLNCFEKGKCFFSDDIDKIIDTIHRSQVLVLVTPVFFHSVPGKGKDFIDRLTYLTHRLEFTGKLGIILTTSTGNGNKEVEVVLEKFLDHLGIITIEKSRFPNDFFRLDDKAMIMTSKLRIFEQLPERVNIPQRFEEIFGILKERYEVEYAKLEENFERDFWINNYSHFNNFTELYLKRTSQ